MAKDYLKIKYFITSSLQARKNGDKSTDTMNAGPLITNCAPPPLDTCYSKFSLQALRLKENLIYTYKWERPAANACTSLNFLGPCNCSYQIISTGAFRLPCFAPGGRVQSVAQQDRYSSRRCHTRHYKPKRQNSMLISQILNSTGSISCRILRKNRFHNFKKPNAICIDEVICF